MATDKQNIKSWDSFRDSIIESAFVVEETEADKLKRIERLEANPEQWYRYYFPSFYKSEPAPFQRRSSARIIANPRWYEVKAWARSLAKSARTMMDTLFLSYTGKLPAPVLLVSNNLDNAERLLKPYKIIIESNPRLINDYGVQKTEGRWTDTEFKLKNKTLFLAVGAGQSPRGVREGAARPMKIIFDDIDTDAEVRNPEQIQRKWEWIEQAVISTLDPSEPIRIVFCGNIIGKDTTITRAAEMADHAEVVNIRNKKGVSTWPQKNSEAHIDRVLDKISYASGQKEYFNNPIKQGTVFKDFTWASIPSPRNFKYLVCYTDPSYKSGKKNDFKATVLIGKLKDTYYLINGFCEQTTTERMVKWHYELNEFVNDRTAVYYYMESNFMQDTLLSAFDVMAKKVNKTIPIRGDDRQKPDKYARIESTLEPLINRGKFVFNIKMKNNPHFKKIVEQFELFGAGSSAHDDAPDACEGGVFIINEKMVQLPNDAIKVVNKPRSKNRF